MPEEHLRALPAGQRIEEYEVVHVLGVGRLGITYLAFDHQFDGPVALKEYFPTGIAARAGDQHVTVASTGNRGLFTWGLDRFISEARVLSRVDHPNVVWVHRCFESNNTAYFAMEYVDGDPLATVLKKYGPLPPEQWRRWMFALLDGLEHVHRHDSLHQDIKPENIVIRVSPARESQPVLIDFGAARRAVADQARHPTTVNTYGYTPIEQFPLKNPMGPPTDIYALAAVSYHVLTGDLPLAAADRIASDKYRPLGERIAAAGQAAWLEEIDRGLCLYPRDRPRTVSIWGAKLAGALGDARQEAGWYRRGVKQGDAQAQNNLGFMHERGEGVPQDYEEAVEWYRKAADQGYAPAQYNLGVMYRKGTGVSQDDEKAKAWYQKAAAQGHAKAQRNLGFLQREL